MKISNGFVAQLTSCESRTAELKVGLIPKYDRKGFKSKHAQLILTVMHSNDTKVEKIHKW